MTARFLVRVGVFSLAAVLGLGCVGFALNAEALAAPSAPSAFSTQVLAIQDSPGQGGQPGQGVGDGRIPLFGKITAVHSGSIDILNANGDTVSVKLTDKTEYRKDRQPAKRTDFKVGDLILVRGEENSDNAWTAQVIATRSMNGGGRGGAGGGPGGRERGEFAQQVGTQGKDFVTGEIKSVDAPKISVLRTDKVTQTIELNEDTSLRKGRDAITMADIQPGDHVFARGGMQNDAFVPKVVVIVGPEQWKRMQEWSQGGEGNGGRRRRPAGSTAPGGTGTDAGSAPSEPGAPGAPPAPPSSSDTPKPPEPQI
jgi:Domain of unknown function (DUF5666)